MKTAKKLAWLNLPVGASWFLYTSHGRDLFLHFPIVRFNVYVDVAGPPSVVSIQKLRSATNPKDGGVQTLSLTYTAQTDPPFHGFNTFSRPSTQSGSIFIVMISIPCFFALSHSLATSLPFVMNRHTASKLVARRVLKNLRAL